jgi:hypothetical protein
MPRAFSAARRRIIDETKYFRLRAGETHRFIAVWVVVVNGRVLVRSWNDKPTGWFRAFLAERRGAIRLGDSEVRVRAARVRSASLLAAADAAYAAKYRSAANRPYVRGFATAKRRPNTLELTPA